MSGLFDHVPATLPGVVWTAAYTAIAISIGSLIVSAGGLLYTHSSKKRELFVKVFDELLDSERQRGRQILFEWCENGSPPSSWPAEDMRKANHALTWFELMSYLHNKRYISRQDSFAIWGATAVRSYRAAEQTGFIDHRNGQQGQEIWPQLGKFVRAAEAKGVVGNAPRPIDPIAT
jgi:hypothetical protein